MLLSRSADPVVEVGPCGWVVEEVHCKDEYGEEVAHNEVEVGCGEKEVLEEDMGHAEEAADGQSNKDALVVHLGGHEDESGCEQGRLLTAVEA